MTAMYSLRICGGGCGGEGMGGGGHIVPHLSPARTSMNRSGPCCLRNWMKYLYLSSELCWMICRLVFGRFSRYTFWSRKSRILVMA